MIAQITMLTRKYQRSIIVVIFIYVLVTLSGALIILKTIRELIQ